MMIYAFGDYELDTQRYELCCAGKRLKIEPQVFNVLAYLMQHRDRTVTRQELLEQLWPEQFISDAVLSYCIMSARKAIGDSGRTQRLIKTVHGRGFRFVARLQACDREPTPMETPSAADTPGRANQARHDTPVSGPTPFAAAIPVPAGAPGGASPLATVLCATLADVTRLADQLGFEALQRLRQAFFALAQHLAQQHQGTLQFFGADGIVVLFGVTSTCAAHAQRAVLAATELQRRLRALDAGISPSQVAASAVRMGLHTGPVAADALSSQAQITPTTLGETLHLAVWLQYLTEPGTLLTSEATLQLMQGEVRDTARREVNVPGQPHPIKAYTINSISP
jgi:DNA-binding winged helix-turn-helix (wHTH) protein/class 3 adenylate cyclase